MREMDVREFVMKYQIKLDWMDIYILGGDFQTGKAEVVLNGRDFGEDGVVEIDGERIRIIGTAKFLYRETEEKVHAGINDYSVYEPVKVLE